ncbi:MAG: Nif3-like dinuclear metal center hexameric protein [Eubacteriales bacterium]|nr:Nif3-like dinuclear metal center hexameric protein [Eubacteriales bacterium]
MKLEQVIAKLEHLSPPQFAAGWDNSGLQVGRYDQEISAVCLAVDATTPVITFAEQQGADLLLTHHPLLFGGIKRIHDRDYIGSRIIRLIRNDISCYAMHTNFDVIGMADAAADLLRLTDRRVLEVTCRDEVSTEGIGRTGQLPEHMKLDEFAEYVKKAFRLEQVRVYGNAGDTVVTCAVLPGSGKEEIDLAVAAGADVMVTGDVNHHAGLDAIEKGIAVIDAGHYGVEKLFVPYMEDYLHRKLPSLEVLRAPEEEPCHLV